MSDSERAASAETYQEKALRKFKQQPLVPIGALATTFALVMAGSKLRKRESRSMNYWLRARVIAQGFTIVAVVAGSWMMGQTKQQLDQGTTATAAAASQEDELVGRERRKAEFEERLRGAEESHRLEMAAAAGMGPVRQGKTTADQEVKTLNEDKENSTGSSWSALGKAMWFGDSARKTPPPPALPIPPTSTPVTSSTTSGEKKS